MQQLNGRVAVVTGGASGIGRGLVNRFAAEGMKVVIADVEKDPLDQAVSEVVSTGAEAIGVVTDVSDREAVENLAAATMDAFGAVHVLCNNAGVETGGAFQDIPLSGWRWVIEVNVFGVIHGCQVFLPLLRQQEEGHIVNTASVAAFEMGVPTMAPYTASKCAVLGLSESLAFELRAADARVGVSRLAPGVVRTRITDAERNRPADVPLSGPDPVRRAVLNPVLHQRGVGHDKSGQVGFGMGIHQRVGQHVARLEAEALLTALARRVRGIELAGPTVRHHNSTLRPVVVALAAEYVASAGAR